MTDRSAVPIATERAANLKSCCAALYEHDWMSLLLGPSFHPGGADLTRRLATMAGVREADTIVDVASGPGTTAFLLTEEYGAKVKGIDLGAMSVARASERARELSLPVTFSVGDAERLPVGDASVNGVFCECAFCTFPSKPDAAAEFARVLRPAGYLAFSDVVVDRSRLDPALDSLMGWIACLADARSQAGYEGFLSEAGLKVVAAERHDDALADLVESLDARLKVLSLLRLPELEGLDLHRALELVSLARDAVDAGVAGYVLMVAEKL